MANLRSNNTKKGGGKLKSSLAGSKSGSVMRNSEINLKNVGNNPSERYLAEPKVISDNKSISNGIITRSGRIKKKKCKEALKNMDNILKSELLIDINKKKHAKKLPGSPINNGINNNSDFVTNQNKTTPQKGYSESPKRPTRTNSKNNVTSENNKTPNNLVGKIRVARNIFQEDSEGVVEDQNMTVLNPKAANKTSKKKPGNKDTLNVPKMDSAVRQDVLSKMKSVLSPDDLQETVSKKPKSDKDKKLKKTKKTKADAKTKQVRLSNGVVLTLSLVECDHCQKTFSNKASLTRHMFSHFDLKPYHCRHCLRKFRYQTTLKVHIQRNHSNTQKIVEFYVCHICDKSFQMEENLELHLASHVKTENNFTCLFCDKKFSHRLLLLQHEKTHLETGRYKCYMCDVSYDSRIRLSYHIKKHSKVKDYICQYCGKEFVRLNSIKRHVRVCHGGHRIQCPICFKDLKGHLTEHMRVHEQNKPHVCQDCGQRFTQSTQLRVHRRSHTGARPYSCKICDHKFGHSNALMLHIRKHTGEKPFPCAMCPMTFSQLPHMKTHMRKIHGKDGAYKCNKCATFFKLKADLVAHSKTCTVGDRELSFEEKIQASVQIEELQFESVMSISKMRFLLALLLTLIASKERLKYLGFNKRLIDDLLEESLEAMGHEPCTDATLSPLKRLKTNIELLLEGTIPREQMERFRSENKSIEEILAMLTEDAKK